MNNRNIMIIVCIFALIATLGISFIFMSAMKKERYDRIDACMMFHPSETCEKIYQ